MASGDTIYHGAYTSFVPEATGTPGASDQLGATYDGFSRGLSFPPKVSCGAYAVLRLPANASLATGATVKLLVADDPLNSIAGKAVVIGVNFGLLGTSSAYVAPAAAALGTEATVTVTMPSTAGQTMEVSIPIVVANMASAAASKWVLFRIRRLGANSSDTGTLGRLMVLGVTVLDT